MKTIYTCLAPFLFLLVLPFFALSQTADSKKEDALAGKGGPSISKEPFGETAGQTVYQYTLKNTNGMVVKVMNYGGSITDIVTPDKNGEGGSVVLGFDSLASYTGRSNALMGAIVGRVANRIANKTFTLDGKDYVLTSYIHGGAQGFDKKIWNIEELPGKKEVGLRLTYFSKDGEEGYPGNLAVAVVYSLTNKNELKITYTATTDKATPLVLTNHTYFNLSGGKDNKVLNTELTLAADQYLEADNDPMPTGALLSVKGTPFDFTRSRTIGEKIAETRNGNGYDLTFALRNQSGRLAKTATAYEPLSGRRLEVYSTEPGLVFYTSNHLSERGIGRSGKPFSKHGAFCLETQHYPDSPHHPNFPNTILRPGETFHSQTIYKFSVL